MATETSGQAFEDGKETATAVLDKAVDAEREVLGAVDDAQDVVGKATPVSTEYKEVASPSDLKSRLNWGEPALSIVDVRDRDAFNYERITGAMPMPMDSLLTSAAASFESSRDIYIYGDSKEQASQAANQLQSNGFSKVSVIEGGLGAWKAIGGPVEGQIMAGPTNKQMLP
ncbi:MAG: rhodanese-like domain-containing protein [Cyanobacteria bacterium J06597_16]